MPKAKKKRRAATQQSDSNPPTQLSTDGAVPSSPRAQKSGAACADVPAPQSPGASQVKELESEVKACAQREAAAKRGMYAARETVRVAKRVLDVKMKQAETGRKRKLGALAKLKLIDKHSKMTDFSYYDYTAAVMAFNSAYSAYQEACLATADAKIRNLVAKLASVKRRLRRRKVFGLMRWR